MTDEGGGVLAATATKPADTEFNNVYTATGALDIELVINPTKTLTGRDLTAGEFTFILRQGAQDLQTVTNDAQGNILFQPLVYTEADIGQTYSYSITEAAGEAADVTYSDLNLLFTVSVADAGNGALSLTTTVTGGAIFINTYTPEPEPVPQPRFDYGTVGISVSDLFE